MSAILEVVNKLASISTDYEVPERVVNELFEQNRERLLSEAEELKDYAIKIDVNEYKVRFYNKGLEVVVDISNYPLLLPCNCGIAPSVRAVLRCEDLEQKLSVKKKLSKWLTMRFPCPLHSNLSEHELEKVGEIFKIPSFIYYKDFGVIWHNGSVWPPSIDSALFVNWIEEKAYLKEHRKVLDLGAGTGFLGLYAAYAFDLEEVTLSDFDPLAYFFSLLNSKLAKQEHGIEVKVVLSDAFSRINEKYDAILCNPPYLPVAGQEGSPIFGTRLLMEAASKYHHYTKELYLMFSSLTLDVLELGKNVEIIGKEMVPFRVPSVLLNTEVFCHYLAEMEENLNYFVKEDNPFPVWHEVMLTKWW